MKKIIPRALTGLFFLFLFAQTLPFLSRTNMQQIVIFTYSVLLTSIFLFAVLKRDRQNPLKYLYFMIISIASFILYLFGFSGSISGFILAATVPYFILNNIRTPAELIRVIFPAIKWGCVFIIIFGTIMFLDIRGQLNNMALMSKFFVEASINYASLLFYGFTILYVVLLDIKQRYLKPPPKLEYILAVLMLSASAFFSAMYLTRITFVASIILFGVFFRRNTFLLVTAVVVAIFIFGDEVFGYLTGMLGSDSVRELATQDVRIESINNLIDNALLFNYDFSSTMSYSSLVNVVFCLFPFTLIFGIQLIYFGISIFLFERLAIKIFYVVLFLTASMVSLYQMDFFSPFALFMIGQLFLFEQKFLVNQKRSLSSSIN